ncbi:MAG TPA: TatD family hydrolase [Candidatus Limnocylindria bacterium]|nr:TatD family hydrolase [Candidatus Limnocylindria bacterium]
MTAYPEPPSPLSVPVYDSHCHLDLGEAGREGESEGLDVEEALARARAVGVQGIVQIGCDLPSARWSVEVAERTPGILAGVALHPNEAPRLAAQGREVLEVAWAEIDALAAHPRVRAVGETGLDFFRTEEDGRPPQEESFRRHIAMAKAHGKALVIHDREAHDDVVRVLDSEGAPETVVFHCFSGGPELARVCADRGWYLSFAGTVTFKNAANLRAALAVAPLDRLLVETDAPFLTPVPHRGKPNASYLIPHTIRAMAGVLDLEEDDLSAAIAASSRRVFGDF